MRKIKEFPLHPFLFCLYVVLFIYAQNISQVRLSMTGRTLMLSLLFTAVIYALAYLSFKDRKKTGVLCTLLLVGLFSYGGIYNKVEHLYYLGKFPFSNIHRYFLLLYFIFYSFIFVWIYRSSRKFSHANYFLNVFVIILFVINLVPIIQYSFSNGSASFGKNTNPNPFLATIGNDNGDSLSQSKNDMPDIYYIILDGYGRNDILKKFYNYDNSNFTNFLKSKGFYIADSSQTNYPYTSKSLASSLNLNYIDSLPNKTLISDQDLISQNYLSYYLKQKHYKIVNVKSGYAITSNFDFADRTIKHGGINEFERSIMQLTILRLDDLLGISTYFTLKGVINGMDQIEKESSPKFSFIHIVAPHPPYIFNKDGSFNTKKPIGHAFWEPRTDYIDQLQYINTVVEKFISSVLSKSNKLPIIILQSDHGPWISSKSEDNIYNARCGILNAYLVPERIKDKLYQTITPVNSFRIVVNDLFEKQFEMLPDIAPDNKEITSNAILNNCLKE